MCVIGYMSAAAMDYALEHYYHTTISNQGKMSLTPEGNNQVVTPKQPSMDFSLIPSVHADALCFIAQI